MVAENFPIEPGHILRFRRALGDPDPTDGQRAAAPPTYTAASAEHDEGWWLRPHIGEPWWGSGATPGTPGTGRGLHAEQHFVYHRPIIAGETLHGSVSVGDTWEKPGRRGVLTFSEETTEWRDDAGDPVVTERRVRVTTPSPPVSAPTS
jgi:N-terminal half of MaoC dehydratase